MGDDVTVPAPGDDEVLRVRRLNLADGSPFAVVTVWCPAELAAGLSRADVDSNQCAGLSVGGALHSLLALDRNGEPLTVPI